jgi:predicted nuclease with TOPRIM domain
MFNNTDDLKEMQKGLKNAFKAIKSEMNVHLETINQNSSEIESIYQYLNELDSKIEKLNERIDEVQMFVNPQQDEQFAIELTNREQEVFLVIYSENNLISAKDISRKLGFTDEMVNRYVYNMISKGVPLLRQYKDNEVLVSMDLKFKDLQARKNVLKIDESISKQLLSDKAL